MFICVDDTDIKGSPGTGRVARNLATYLEELKLGISLGVTRHQLLVDSRIKYTTQNSSKCIALKTDKATSNFYEPCYNFLKNCLQEGADPGLCICSREQVNKDIQNFGIKATTIVLQKQNAIELANANKIFLREIGGTGDGIIGALAGVGLRRRGNGGRFIELRGVRDITGLISVEELKKRTDIKSVQDTNGKALANNEIIDSKDWLRPTLFNEKAVLIVKPIQSKTGEKLWLSIEKRNRPEDE